MNNLKNALKRLKVETGSLACLGCGREHNCTTRGCAIIREAIEVLSCARWISVEEWLPDTGWYLVRCNQWGGRVHRIAFWDDREGEWTEWTDEGYDITKFVTHWKQLPDPPEEDEI